MFYRQTATESTAAAVLLCVALEYEWVNKMSPHRSAHAEVGVLMRQVSSEFSHSSPSDPEGAAKAAAAMRKAFEMLNFCCRCHGSLQDWSRPGRRYHHRCTEKTQCLDGRATGA